MNGTTEAQKKCYPGIGNEKDKTERAPVGTNKGRPMKQLSAGNKSAMTRSDSGLRRARPEVVIGMTQLFSLGSTGSDISRTTRPRLNTGACRQP